MPYDTDERLKSYLDTNQLRREQMCLAVLAIDKRFTNVKPRHPRGGRDGGRDIEATLQGSQKVFGAVGFVNQADDSDRNKSASKKKFESDLGSALEANPQLAGFVFFTNVNLTVGEEDELISAAKNKNVGYCEIFDRERLRISLDSPDGLSIRFQFLDLELSRAEQAAFFARWGDDIQSVIAHGFGEMKTVLNRMQFLYESGSVLDHFVVVTELDREYIPSEIGHFRLFCSLALKEPKNNIFSIEFGTTDNVSRVKAKVESDLDRRQSGVGRGMCGGQWEARLVEGSSAAKEEEIPYEETSSFTHVGLRTIGSLKAEFGYDSFIRTGPYLCLKDLDDCIFAIFVNESLAKKIRKIHVFGNEYKLLELDERNFRIDTGFKDFEPKLTFSGEELQDKWVRLMADIGPFHLSFSSTTPVRLFEPDRVADSGIRNRSR
jgi:hypothetical protein